MTDGERHDVFIAALGGDQLATRTANALARNNVRTVDDLRLIATAGGQEELDRFLASIRNLGSKAQRRIDMTLAGMMDAPVADGMVQELRARAIVPTALLERMRNTVHLMQTDNRESIDAFCGSARGVPCLTRADLVLLLGMFQELGASEEGGT